MIRIFLFIVVVVAGAIGLAWFADRPGTVNIEWLGYQIETSAFIAAIAILTIVGLLLAIWSLFRFLATRPAAITAFMKERRRKQGFDGPTCVIVEGPATLNR